MAADTRTTPLLSDYLKAPELAKELRMSVRTLARLDAKRAGPPKTRIGGRIFYHRASAAAWLREQEQARERPARRRRR